MKTRLTVAAMLCAVALIAMLIWYQRVMEPVERWNRMHTLLTGIQDVVDIAGETPGELSWKSQVHDALIRRFPTEFSNSTGSMEYVSGYFWRDSSHINKVSIQSHAILLVFPERTPQLCPYGSSYLDGRGIMLRCESGTHFTLDHDSVVMVGFYSGEIRIMQAGELATLASRSGGGSGGTPHEAPQPDEK